MKLTFELIKQIITSLVTATSLVSFIVTTLCTNTKSQNFIEYTDLSKFFLNFYIFIILLLCFCLSIYPKLVCKIFTDKIGIISSDKGKIVIQTSIFIMYFSTESMPQKLFGMISFVEVFGLFLADLLLNCDTLKQKPLNNERIVSINKHSPSPVIITNTDNTAQIVNNPIEVKN